MEKKEKILATSNSSYLKKSIVRLTKKLNSKCPFFSGSIVAFKKIFFNATMVKPVIRGSILVVVLLLATFDFSTGSTFSKYLSNYYPILAPQGRSGTTLLRHTVFAAGVTRTQLIVAPLFWFSYYDKKKRRLGPFIKDIINRGGGRFSKNYVDKILDIFDPLPLRVDKHTGR